MTIAAVLLFSALHTNGAPFFATLAACGAMVVGSQFCLSAVANRFYPAEMRATGAGYALGAGRCGAVLAPIVGGFVLARVSSPSAAFATGVVPATLSLAAVLLLGRTRGWRARRIGA